jgi:TPR repeat protein
VLAARCLLVAGVCYDQGRGVAKDESKALKWWQAAADQGLAQAQVYLGMCPCPGVLKVPSIAHCP